MRDETERRRNENENENERKCYHSQKVLLSELWGCQLHRGGNVGQREGHVCLSQAQNVPAVEGLHHLGGQSSVLVLFKGEVERFFFR